MRKKLFAGVLAGMCFLVSACGNAESNMENTQYAKVDSVGKEIEKTEEAMEKTTSEEQNENISEDEWSDIYGGKKPINEITPDIIKPDSSPMTRDEIMSVFSEDKMADIMVAIKRDNVSRDEIYSNLGIANPYMTILADCGMYVSAIPYQRYEAEAMKISVPELFLFDKNKNYLGNLVITKDETGYKLDSDNMFGESINQTFNIFEKEIVMRNPEQKYVVIYNSTEGYVDDKNEVHFRENALDRVKWTLSGDVYSPLSEFAFSYNDISSDENLIWIDFGN